MSSLPDAPLEEVMDTTSSWQFVSDSDVANHHPGSFTRDKISGHSSHLVSRVTKSIRAEPNGAPCAEPSGSAPDHMTYYPPDMWKLNTTPPHSQEAGYGPTAATTYRYDYSSSDSHLSSHGGGAYVHFSDCHPSSSPSSFTPINQNGSTALFSSPKASGTALC